MSWIEKVMVGYENSATSCDSNWNVRGKRIYTWICKIRQNWFKCLGGWWTNDVTYVTHGTHVRKSDCCKTLWSFVLQNFTGKHISTIVLLRRITVHVQGPTNTFITVHGFSVLFLTICDFSAMLSGHKIYTATAVLSVVLWCMPIELDQGTNDLQSIWYYCHHRHFDKGQAHKKTLIVTCFYLMGL